MGGRREGRERVRGRGVREGKRVGEGREGRKRARGRGGRGRRKRTKN